MSENTERLGEFLVRIGAMTEEQVHIVLEKQKDQPERLFGEIAIDLGFVDDQAVDTFLGSIK